jgi:arylsulfatase A-like enzyme
VLSTLVALATSGCSSPAPSAAPRRPHVVLVLVDTLRADALGVLGSPHATPRLDRLAGEGVVFTTAIAPSTWTLPSVASLITSLHPSEHGLLGAEEGAEQMPQNLDAGLLTMAEAFHDGGYLTAGVVNQIYLRYKFGFGQGYDYYDTLRGQDAFRINAKAMEWLDQRGAAAPGGASQATAPLFLYLHYLDPHWPYEYRIEGPVPAGLAAADADPGVPRLPDLASTWMADQRDDELRRRGVATLAARYALEVQWVDTAVGNLIDLLAARGLWDDTILVVTSDHGEGFWEHQRLLHGHAPYDEQIRVPLVIRFPAWMRVEPGRRSAPVGLIDLMPTLLDLAGIAVPAECRGRSLTAAIRGEEDAARAILVETGHERALRTRDAKLLVRRDREAASLEYYDLAADPAELRNLATPCDGPCRDDVRRLREIEDALVARDGDRAPPSGVTPEEVEELRTLGYLDD